MKNQTATRPYRMGARARSVAETGERILDAAAARFSTMSFDEVTLNDIAADSDVTVQTVIRRFGSKEDLFALLVERETGRILAEREPENVEAGDLPSAIATLVAHYERDGETMINLLDQESRFPQVGEVVAAGRRSHEAWVQRHCSRVLAASTGSGRARKLEAAIAATDLYVWKLLRLDRGLSPEEVAKTMLTLLEGLGETGDE